jgi:hypothetical protein
MLDLVRLLAPGGGDGETELIGEFLQLALPRARASRAAAVGGDQQALGVWKEVPSRLVLEFADASRGDIRLSDHAARSMISSDVFAARACHPSTFLSPAHYPVRVGDGPITPSSSTSVSAMFSGNF